MCQSHALILPVAVVVDERERPTLIGDGERELVVVHQANFLDLGSVINVVQKDGVTQDFCFLRRRHLNRVGTHLPAENGGKIDRNKRTLVNERTSPVG